MLTEKQKEKRREGSRNLTPEQRDRKNELARNSYYRNYTSRRQRQKNAWTEERAKKHDERRRVRSRANPKAYILRAARKRAGERGIECTINESHFDIPEFCPILKVKLNEVMSHTKEKHLSPSLDRIDNSKGYIPGNVAVISMGANHNKGNLSLQDIERLYKYTRRELDAEIGRVK